MKSSNLAWRIERDEEQADLPVVPGKSEAQTDQVEPMRARSRFERRTIEIHDQGFAPFRLR
jgi:hypothetical protein